MAILPLQLPTNRIDSSFDLYTPLAALGQQWAKNRDEAEAAQLVAKLFGQAQTQDAAAAQPVAASPPPSQQAAPPMQAPPRGPLPPDPVSQPRGLTRTGETEMTPQQRLIASHEAVTQDPAQRVEGGFNDLRRVIIDTPRGGQAAFAPEEPAAAPAQPAAADPMARARQAISANESGGNYQELGPVTRTGDRAYGKYQVMGTNIPDWSEKYFGQRLTPQQFIANPAAQDAVFNGKFGEYTQKYGPTNAAKAWFAGERGMNNPNATDRIVRDGKVVFPGTTVSSYAAKFNAGMGGLPPEITSGSSRPPQAPEGLPPSQAAAYDSVASNLAQPGAPAKAAGISREQIAQLYRNPVTRPLATAYLQKALDPGKYDFMVAGENVFRFNKADGSWAEIPLKQKPMVVGEEQRIYDPNTKTFVTGPSEAGKYGKIGIGERWIDPNNKALGVEPIPGGEKEKIEAETSGRIGLAKKYLSEVGDITQRIQAGELGIDNPSNHFKALAGVGKPGELRRKIDTGSDALIRMLTGQGMPISEASTYARRYQVTPTDTKETLLSKTRDLSTELIFVGKEVGKGRGGFKLENGKLTIGGVPVGGDKPAGGTRTQDDEARDWVRQNPNDPRAAAIKRRLGM